MSDKKPFAAEVWQTLSDIDLTGLTDVVETKKKQYTYLSWSNAWAVLMTVYPESNYKLLDNEYFHDGTVSVAVEVTVSDGENSLTRSMFLQVLSYSMRAVEHPNAHVINNTRMRCLTKCLALFGLGGYLYQGQDLPTAGDVEVVARVPRIPHEEFYENVRTKMDEATRLDMLKIQTRGGYDYFKKWGEAGYCEQLQEHFEKLSKTFEPIDDKEGNDNE